LLILVCIGIVGIIVLKLVSNKKKDQRKEPAGTG
jgi:hypothetical protein